MCAYLSVQIHRPILREPHQRHSASSCRISKCLCMLSASAFTRVSHALSTNRGLAQSGVMGGVLFYRYSSLAPTDTVLIQTRKCLLKPSTSAAPFNKPRGSMKRFGLKLLRQKTVQVSVNASLATSTALPTTSGIAWLDNSQGASATLAEFTDALSSVVAAVDLSDGRMRRSLPPRPRRIQVG